MMIGLSAFESFNLIIIPNSFLNIIISNTAFFYVLQILLVITMIMYYFMCICSAPFLGNSVLLEVQARFYVYIYNLLGQQLNRMRTHLVPHVYTIALLILCSNVFGLLPYGFSITAFPGVTLVLSSVSFFSCVFLAIFIPMYNDDVYRKKYFYFLGFFAPHDVPVWLFPLIISIEIISFFFRLVSLGFRLAANLMAGHILISLLSLVYCSLMMVLSNSLFLVCIFTFMVCVLIFFELFVAFLQTYVFVVLLCSYYNDVYHHFDK